VGGASGGRFFQKQLFIKMIMKTCNFFSNFFFDDNMIHKNTHFFLPSPVPVGGASGGRFFSKATFYKNLS